MPCAVANRFHPFKFAQNRFGFPARSADGLANRSLHRARLGYCWSSEWRVVETS